MRKGSSIFSDPTLQASFTQHGFVILPELLNHDEVKQLNELYFSFSDQINQPFHTSHFSDDTHYKRTTQQAIFSVVYPKVKQYLIDYKPVFANFMVKNAQQDSFLQMHADWTYVDEEKFRSLSVWIPFVETNKENGCFGVIDASHRFMNTIRGPGIQQNQFIRDRIWVKKYGKLLPIHAGDAILFDHALLHYSLANKSTQPRPALNLSLVPSAATLVHYCIPEGAEDIEKYIVDDLDFFIRYENWKRPEIGNPVSYISKSTIQFIDERVENYGKTHLGFAQRLWSFVKEKMPDDIHG